MDVLGHHFTVLADVRKEEECGGCLFRVKETVVANKDLLQIELVTFIYIPNGKIWKGK